MDLIFLHRLILHSPFGLFAPGFKDMSDQFDLMFADMEVDRKKWGCQSSKRVLSRTRLIAKLPKSSENPLLPYFQTVTQVSAL